MRYQVGGSLRSNDPSYVIRQADAQLYAALKAGDFCYVLNCRQMGKSSLLQQTSHRLEQEGYTCAYLDLTQLGSELTTPLQWYKGIIASLFYDLNLGERVNFKQWWEEQAELSLVQRLHKFVEEVLLQEVPSNFQEDNKSDRIFIFIDEIDSLLSLNFPVNDFFAWIRHCHNLRAKNPNFNRLVFALFGVASPSDLISDKRRTPFNVGQAIELYGFQLHEATPLLKGLEPVISQPQAILREIIHWTGGQPFLTQKLCQLVVQIACESPMGMMTLPAGKEAAWIEELLRSHIIQHWESQDEPEHLRTIRDRLLFNEQRAGRLLGIYQKLLQAEDYKIPTDDSQELTELLLTGLVEKRNGYVLIKNPIYRNVFHQEWVAKQLDNLRPYSQTFNAWVSSNAEDQSRLLRGQALKDAQTWSQGKSLSDLDYRFLAASQECEQREQQIAWEATQAKEVEARLSQEKKTAKLQRFLLVVVGIALFLTSGLGVGSFILYRQTLNSERQARMSEIRALISSSEGLFTSNRRLDALIEAIKAKYKLQQLGQTNTEIQRQVENVLRQAVYTTDEYNRFSGHQAAVLAVDISPDSSVIASASMDKTVKLWRRDGREVATLKGHKGAVRAIAFSPDGQEITSASEDGTVKIWKRDGSLLKTFTGHTGSVWGVAFSPDGKFVASASFDTTVKLWKRDGTLLTTFKGRAGFFKVTFSPDGQTVAAGNVDRTVKLWRRDSTGWQNAKPLQTLQGHNGWLLAVAFSPDGKTLASASDDKTVKLWQRDVKNGRYQVVKTLSGHSAGVWAIAFSPDGQTIASASLDKTIKLWNIDGTELRTLRGHSASALGVRFSKDNSLIASAGAENVVRLWQSQNRFQKSVIAHTSGIWSVNITSDSGTIATASHEKYAKLWSRQGKLLKTLTEDEGAFQVSFSSDRQLMAIVNNDDSVTLRKPDGTLVATYKHTPNKILMALLSPDGQTIAMANVDNMIKIWRRDRPTPLVIKAHQGEVWQVAFSPDSRLVASVSSDGTAKLWTVDGKLLRTFKGHTAAVWRVTFSSDGKMLATGSGDNTAKLWTLDGKLVTTFKGHTAAVWGVAFTPDGKMLATGSVDTTVKLWKLDGTEITTLRGHTAAMRKIAISPDGSFLASVGDDNTLILWNLPRILQLNASAYACTLAQDYLQNNITVEKSDRLICK